MSYETLIEDIRKLPEEGYDDVVAYVEFLTFKFNIKNNASAKKRKIGGLKGSLKYMADDFDAPLDDFKGYM